VADRGFLVVYEVNGAEVARYAVRACAQDEAEGQADAMFCQEHPEVDLFAPNPGLEVRVAPMH
jgi:hypothetical protein